MELLASNAFTHAMAATSSWHATSIRHIRTSPPHANRNVTALPHSGITVIGGTRSRSPTPLMEGVRPMREHSSPAWSPDCA